MAPAADFVERLRSAYRYAVHHDYLAYGSVDPERVRAKALEHLGGVTSQDATS